MGFLYSQTKIFKHDINIDKLNGAIYSLMWPWSQVL